MKTALLLMIVLVSVDCADAQTEFGKKAAELRKSRRAVVVYEIVKLCGTNSDLADELALSDEQSLELGKLCKEIEELLRDRGRTREKGVSIVEARNELLRDVEERIGKVITPRQIRRLDQLANQLDFARLGGGGKLGTATVWVYAFQMIGDTDDWPDLDREFKEIHSTYWKDRQKLWDEKMEEILAVLPPEKREQYLKLVGEVPPPDQWTKSRRIFHRFDE